MMLGAQGPGRAEGLVKALLFDVFGTVVDWRGSIIEEGKAWGKTKGIEVDWAVFELVKYETPVEENDMRMLLPTRPGEPILVEWAHIPGQYPSEWDPELFALVKQGCAGLGARQ